jgi:death-on-curing protein
MRYLALAEVLRIHTRVIAQSGGSEGIRDQSGLESAIAQPRMTFGGSDLYPLLAEKAAALGYSLIANHPFVDGNKRIGHAAMEVFLRLNGHGVEAPVDEQETIVLRVASGEMEREEWTRWVQEHIVALPG